MFVFEAKQKRFSKQVCCVYFLLHPFWACFKATRAEKPILAVRGSLVHFLSGFSKRVQTFLIYKTGSPGSLEVRQPQSNNLGPCLCSDPPPAFKELLLMLRSMRLFLARTDWMPIRRQARFSRLKREAIEWQEGNTVFICLFGCCCFMLAVVGLFCLFRCCWFICLFGNLIVFLLACLVVVGLLNQKVHSCLFVCFTGKRSNSCYCRHSQGRSAHK